MAATSYYVLLTHDAGKQRLFYLRLGGSERPMVVRDEPTLLWLVALDQDFHVYRVSVATPWARLALANEARELRRGMADQEFVLDEDFHRDIAQAVQQGDVYNRRGRIDAGSPT